MICLHSSGDRSQDLVHGGRTLSRLSYIPRCLPLILALLCAAGRPVFTTSHESTCMLSYQPTHHSTTRPPRLRSHSFFLSFSLLPTNLFFSVHLLMLPLGTCFSQLPERTSDPDMKQPPPHLQHRVAIHEPIYPRLQLHRGAESGPTGGRAGFPRTDALQGDVLTQFHMHRALREHRHYRRPCGRNMSRRAVGYIRITVHD